MDKISFSFLQNFKIPIHVAIFIHFHSLHEILKYFTQEVLVEIHNIFDQGNQNILAALIKPLA